MSATNDNSRPLVVHLTGAIDHPDFEEAEALLRSTALCGNDPTALPELVVVAQARPAEIRHREVESLHRRWPLAGIVAILGSWCEGETRTGRPWPGVQRLYWYEFPAWWRRQLALRAAGRCPDWARRGDFGFPAAAGDLLSDCGLKSAAIRNRKGGVIVLNTPRRDTAAALADVLARARYATVWEPPGRSLPPVHGAAAGIWDGGQLNDREADELAAFCRKMSKSAAPVIALLDFPRRDRCEVARELGAADVLGKPWLNAELVGTIDINANRTASLNESTLPRAA